MARIEGVDLPRNKRVEVGLTYLYGVGPTRARAILAHTKVSPDTRIKDLSEAEVAAIREYIEGCKDQSGCLTVRVVLVKVGGQQTTEIRSK